MVCDRCRIVHPDRILGIVDNYHTTRADCGALRGLASNWRLRFLGDNGFGLGIFQRMEELIGLVVWVDRADNTADRESSPDDGRQVDGVGGEHGEDVPFLPGPSLSQRLPKVQSQLPNVSVGITPLGFSVSEEDYAD